MGALPCRVHSLEESGILCTVGPSDPGVAAVSVTVTGAGRDVGGFAILRLFQVTSVQPDVGSLAGGSLLYWNTTVMIMSSLQASAVCWILTTTA